MHSIHRRWAKVKLAFESIHRYPDAPDEVMFLRSPHRHLFVVRVWVEQFNDARDVEYLMLQRWLQRRLSPPPFREDASCEHMAGQIGTWLGDRFPDRNLQVEVCEDDENGALITFAPTDACS